MERGRGGYGVINSDGCVTGKNGHFLLPEEFGFLQYLEEKHFWLATREDEVWW